MENIRVNESTKQQRMKNIIWEQEDLWLVSSNNHRLNAILPNDINNYELDNTGAVLPDSNTDGDLDNNGVIHPDSNTDGEIDITDAERPENGIVIQSLIVVTRESGGNCMVCMESLQDAKNGKIIIV